MRKRAVVSTLVVLGLLAVSCGAGESEQPTSTLEQAVSDQTTTEAPPATTPESTADGSLVETYLTEMSNLAGDLDSQLGDFECSYNEQFSPGLCGVEFVEEGGETEPPPEPSEAEQFDYMRGYWLGSFDVRLDHADVLEAVAPPVGFEQAHANYVDAFRSYFEYLRDQVASFVDLDEFMSFFDLIFDPIAAAPPEVEQRLLVLVDSCLLLVDLGSEAGYESDLGCPSPPEVPVAVEVEIGDGWFGTPNPLPIGDGLVRMTITNTGSEPIRPVVLGIFAEDPLDLPVIDGVVDISRSGEFDPASGYAEFYVHYAGENWEATGEPLELSSGESVEAVVWSEHTLVVFDYRRGEFAAGAYVVIERSGSQ